MNKKNSRQHLKKNIPLLIPLRRPQPQLHARLNIKPFLMSLGNSG